MEEIWKDIDGYEGYYQVSNLGRVKSLNYRRKRVEEQIKTLLNNHGYLCVNLYKDKIVNKRQVHQLVAEAFLNHKSCGHNLVVNHKDFNRQNNQVDNLEITTNRENTNREHIKSTSEYVGVCWSKVHKKWLSRLRINDKRKHLGFFADELEASDAYQNALKTIKEKDNLIAK